jgi:hypothetical protein
MAQYTANNITMTRIASTQRSGRRGYSWPRIWKKKLMPDCEEKDLSIEGGIDRHDRTGLSRIGSMDLPNVNPYVPCLEERRYR